MLLERERGVSERSLLSSLVDDSSLTGTSIIISSFLISPRRSDDLPLELERDLDTERSRRGERERERERLSRLRERRREERRGDLLRSREDLLLLRPFFFY